MPLNPLNAFLLDSKRYSINMVSFFGTSFLVIDALMLKVIDVKRGIISSVFRLIPINFAADQAVVPVRKYSINFSLVISALSAFSVVL